MMLTTLEANIVPVVFEAPERCVIDKRLERDRKGLKAEDIYNAANTVYDWTGLLFSVHKVGVEVKALFKKNLIEHLAL